MTAPADGVVELDDIDALLCDYENCGDTTPGVIHRKRRKKLMDAIESVFARLSAAEADAGRLREAQLQQAGEYIDVCGRLSLAEQALKTRGEMVDALLQHCPIDECEGCALIVCPNKDPLHFHHDDCPSCYFAERDAALDAAGE